MKIKGYDVIGDVHGKLDALTELMARLGYRKESGCWRHADREAVFVGDLVDRGTEVPEVLALVKAMVDAGAAHMVLGNHELGLLAWYTPDGDKQEDGKPVFRRKHKRKYLKYMAQSVAYFDHFPEERDLYLAWFRKIPLALDFGTVRFVHAHWCPETVARFGSGASLADVGWNEPVFSGWRKDAVNLLTKGPEIVLPEGRAIVDRQGNEHKEARINWWMIDHAKDLRELIKPDASSLTGLPIPEKARKHRPPASHEAPVFFGHFGFKECPGLLGENLACVDFQGAQGDRVGAYRWSGEQKLIEKNFVQ